MSASLFRVSCGPQGLWLVRSLAFSSFSSGASCHPSWPADCCLLSWQPQFLHELMVVPETPVWVCLQDHQFILRKSDKGCVCSRPSRLNGFCTGLSPRAAGFVSCWEHNKSCLPSFDWLFPPFFLSPAVGTLCRHYHLHPYNPLTHLSTFFLLSTLTPAPVSTAVSLLLSSSACSLSSVCLSMFDRLWTTWRRGWRRQGSRSAFVRASLLTLLWPSKTSRCLLPPWVVK